MVERLLRYIDGTMFAAFISGLLLAAAFPVSNVSSLAWFALVPLFTFMHKRPLSSGFCAGLAFFAPVLYWLNIVMTSYGGLNPFLALLFYLLLLFYLSSYFALVTWISVGLQQRCAIPTVVSLPFLWVAFEYLRGQFLTGFPWALLGYSQHQFPAAIQSADVTGVYGVSFLLIAVNAALATLLSDRSRSFKVVAVAAVAMMCCTHIGYGVWRLSQPLEQRPEQLGVALVQGNIDQAQKWLPENRQKTIERYTHLSQLALSEGSDLLIWPEAATPFFLQDDTPLARQVRRLPQQWGAPLLLGSPAYERDGNTYNYYNSAYLLSADSSIVQRSDKQHLVPFGEYVPFSNVLTFVDKLVVGIGDFSAGLTRPLSLGEHKLGALICYEVIFPELARAYVQQGSDLLVNLTNDAWFGRSSAPYQHLAIARFRAIENRIWLARAANTGISAFISPAGRIVSEGPLFKPVYLGHRVGLGAEPTLYTRFGDFFAWGCVAVSLGGGLLLLRSGLLRRTWTTQIDGQGEDRFQH